MLSETAMRSAACELPATAIGDYVLARRLDAAHGQLYQATKADGSEYTLAFLHLPRALEDQLDDELERARLLGHRGILRVIETLAHHDQLLVIFESMPGTSLLRLMRHLDDAGEKLPVSTVLYLGHSLLESLEAAAAVSGRPLLHGALGPHQVIVSWQGQVKLLGVGLSPLLGVFRRPAPHWLQPFIAPEVRLGEPPSATSDLYAAAALLWGLLARRACPSHRPLQLHSLRPELDRELCQTIDAALEPRATQRPPVSVLREAFRRFIAPSDAEILRFNMELVRASQSFDDDDVIGREAPWLAARDWRLRSSLAAPRPNDFDDDEPTLERVLPLSLRAGRTISGVRRCHADPREERTGET